MSSTARTTSGVVSSSSSVRMALPTDRPVAAPLSTIVSSPSSSRSSTGVKVKVVDPLRAPAGMVTSRVPLTAYSLAWAVPAIVSVTGVAIGRAISLSSASPAVTVTICEPPSSVMLSGVTDRESVGASRIRSSAPFPRTSGPIGSMRTISTRVSSTRSSTAVTAKVVEPSRPPPGIVMVCGRSAV